MASTTRARSALCKRTRSATTSSTLMVCCRGFFLPLAGKVTCSSRSACTRVKPLAANHCSSSCGVVLAGSSTAKVNTKRGSGWPVAMCAATRSCRAW